MLGKDLVYELIRDKDKVCENYILCAVLGSSPSLNKDSHAPGFLYPPVLKNIVVSGEFANGPV